MDGLVAAGRLGLEPGVERPRTAVAVHNQSTGVVDQSGPSRTLAIEGYEGGFVGDPVGAWPVVVGEEAQPVVQALEVEVEVGQQPGLGTRRRFARRFARHGMRLQPARDLDVCAAVIGTAAAGEEHGCRQQAQRQAPAVPLSRE